MINVDIWINITKYIINKLFLKEVSKTLSPGMDILQHNFPSVGWVSLVGCIFLGMYPLFWNFKHIYKNYLYIFHIIDMYRRNYVLLFNPGFGLVSLTLFNLICLLFLWYFIFLLLFIFMIFCFTSYYSVSSVSSFLVFSLYFFSFFRLISWNVCTDYYY